MWGTAWVICKCQPSPDITSPGADSLWAQEGQRLHVRSSRHHPLHGLELKRGRGSSPASRAPPGGSQYAHLAAWASRHWSEAEVPLVVPADQGHAPLHPDAVLAPAGGVAGLLSMEGGRPVQSLFLELSRYTAVDPCRYRTTQPQGGSPASPGEMGNLGAFTPDVLSRPHFCMYLRLHRRPKASRASAGRQQFSRPGACDQCRAELQVDPFSPSASRTSELT